MNARERRALRRALSRDYQSTLIRSDAERQTRAYQVDLDKRLSNPISGKTMGFARTGKGRYKDPVGMYDDNGVFRIVIPFSSMTTRHDVVSSASIPDSRVSRTDTTDRQYRRQIGLRKAKEPKGFKLVP